MDLFTNGSATPSTNLKNGLGVGNRVARIGLAKAFLNFRQETEPFDGILKGSRIRKSLDNLDDLLFYRFSSQDNHLM